MRSAMTLVVALTALALPRSALSQQPVGELTVSGRVTDSSSGAPVRGALLQVDEFGARAIADSAGAFQLRGVPPGPHRLTVSRFGYATLDVELVATQPPAVLELVMEPNPLALQGIDVLNANVDLVGVVRDAVTGAPVAWASLFLTPDAVRPQARGASGQDGVFELDDVPTGRYLLRVQQVGYVSQFVPVEASAPPEPIELLLQPDSIVQRGLVTFTRDTRSRRNAYPGIAVQYDAEALNMSGVPDAQTFLNYFTRATVVGCAGADAIGAYCILGRGGVPRDARVYIDELPIMAGLDVLRSYSPSDFYVIEVFGTGTIRAYTHAFVEQRARRPRLLLPDP